jgi:hypothetical protein
LLTSRSLSETSKSEGIEARDASMMPKLTDPKVVERQYSKMSGSSSESSRLPEPAVRDPRSAPERINLVFFERDYLSGGKISHLLVMSSDQLWHSGSLHGMAAFTSYSHRFLRGCCCDNLCHGRFPSPPIADEQSWVLGLPASKPVGV